MTSNTSPNITFLQRRGRGLGLVFLVLATAMVSAACDHDRTTASGHYAGRTTVISSHCATRACSNAEHGAAARILRSVLPGETIPTRTIDQAAGQGAQFLVALRVGEEAEVQGGLPYIMGFPDEVEMFPSPSYAAELESFAPAPAGTRWIGYQSGVEYQQLPDSRIDVFVTLQAATPGQPLGDVVAGLLVGMRYVSTDGAQAGYVDPASPVDCLDAAGNPNDGVNCGGTETWDPTTMTPAALLSHTSDTVTAVDASVAAPAATAIAAGGSGSIAFTGNVTGGSFANDTAFAVTATTNVPGGTATPTVATWTARAQGATSLPTTVTVPAGTPAGTYAVTLQAVRQPAFNGDSEVRRSAVATITVGAPGAGNPPASPLPPTGGAGEGPGTKDTVPPVVGFAPAKALALAGNGSVALPVTCGEPAGGACLGKVSVSALLPAPGPRGKAKPVMLGSASFTVPGATSKVVKVKLSKRARVAVARSRSLVSTVALTVRDGAGNVTTITRKVKLQAPKRRR